MMIHDEISKRAREIWEREGRPEGRDMEHWLQAEAELREKSIKRQPTGDITSAEGSMVNASAGLNERTEPARKRSARRSKSAA